MAKRRTNFLNAAELILRPPQAWLLPEIMPRGTLSVLFAPPKSAKSFLALSWSASLAHAGNNVIYIAGEGVGGLGARLRAWSQQHRIKFRDDFPLFFPDVPLNVFSKAACEAFVRNVREHGAFLKQVEGEEDRDVVDLIVVDTLSRCMIGADENDASDVSIAIDNLDEIRRVLGATVLILHHTQKSNVRVERGSTALRGAADVMLRLSRKDGRYILSIQAARDFESGGEFYYDAVEAADSAAIDTSQEAPNGAPVQAAVFECIRKGLIHPRDIRDTLNVSGQAVADALGKLLEKGAITKAERGTYKAREQT